MELSLIKGKMIHINLGVFVTSLVLNVTFEICLPKNQIKPETVFQEKWWRSHGELTRTGMRAGLEVEREYCPCLMLRFSLIPRTLEIIQVKTIVTRSSFELSWIVLGTLLPKPAAAPAAHSILRNGSVASSSYVPTFEKQKPMVKAGSASPYSTLSRPGSSFSNGKPEPTP